MVYALTDDLKNMKTDDISLIDTTFYKSNALKTKFRNCLPPAFGDDIEASMPDVNTSGKAGAQIPQLPLGDDAPPMGEIMQYVCNLTRFTRLGVTSHSQPLINAKHKFQVTNYLQTIF
jgi:hypothetical protein